MAVAVACGVARVAKAVGFGVVGVDSDGALSLTVGSVCGIAMATGVAVTARFDWLDTTSPMPAMTRTAAIVQRMIRLVFDDEFMEISLWREVLVPRRFERVHPRRNVV